MIQAYHFVIMNGQTIKLFM